MSRRKYREAAMAKRLSPDDIALARSFGGPVDLTPAEALQADHAYNAFKNDPSIRIDAAHQVEVNMLRVLRGAIG